MAVARYLHFDSDFFNKYATLAYYLSRGASGNVYGPIKWNDMQLAIKQATFADGYVTDKVKKDIEVKKAIWTSLEHGHLTRIHSVDLSQFPKAMFIVMEFAAGGSLNKTLRSLGSDNKLPIDVVTDWAKQIAEGMLYLHEKNIVHRDLKSSNILLMEPFDIRNSETIVTLKITDFDEVKEHDHTATMSFVGTCAYMAPEVLVNQRFSKASDVWSYGVMIWEMLSGDAPHLGLEQITILYKSVHGELDNLPLKQSFPTDYKLLLNRCWESTCRERISFEEIFCVLQRMAQRQDVTEIGLLSKVSDYALNESADSVVTERSQYGQKNYEEDLVALNDQPKEGLQEHGQRIQTKYSQLVSNLSCVGDMIAAMYQKRKLSLKEIEQIQALQSTPIRANEELLNIIARKPRDVYECFLSLIKDTHQLHLYQMLVSGDDTKREDSPDHKDLIRRNFMWLSEKLDTENGLISLLYQQNVLTVRERECILCMNIAFQKSELLLGVLSKKSPDVFEKFLEALEDSGQGHLAKKLRKPEGNNQDLLTRQNEKTGSLELSEEEQLEPIKPQRYTVEEKSLETDRILKVGDELEGEKHRRQQELEDKLSNATTQLKQFNPKLEDRVGLSDDSTDAAFSTDAAICEEIALMDTRHPVSDEAVTERKDSVRYERLQNGNKQFEEDRVAVKKLSKRPIPAIFGLAVLYQEVFISRLKRPDIEVYDSTTFHFKRRMTVSEMINPEHIVSCSVNNCLYAFDWKDEENNKILQINPFNGKLINNWEVLEVGGRLSIASDTNVIVNINHKAKLHEYTADGELIRMINLGRDTDGQSTGIIQAWHAVKLNNGQFVVCHGDYDDPMSRVCLLSIKASRPTPAMGRIDEVEILKVFGGRQGDSINRLMRPVYLSVDKEGSILVLDASSNRAVLLSTNLDKPRILVSDENGIELPWRACFDKTTGEWLVADYKSIIVCRMKDKKVERKLYNIIIH